VLLLILYNNKYTPYKINDFSKFWMFVFFFVVVLMQLVEYFIWVNVDDVFYNKLFTYCAILIVFLQPITTMMTISNDKIKKILISSYLMIAVPYIGYSIYMYHNNIYSTVGADGHLKWNIFDERLFSISSMMMGIWFLFFLFPLFYEKYILGLLFGMLTLLVMLYNYLKYYTVASMWCWIVNSIMLYYAGNLLFYLPFVKSI
jgi:hypothetical protein